MHFFALGDSSPLVAQWLYSGYISILRTWSLRHFAVKLFSCSNYVTICGGISDFLFQIYDVWAELECNVIFCLM